MNNKPVTKSSDCSSRNNYGSILKCFEIALAIVTLFLAYTVNTSIKDYQNAQKVSNSSEIVRELVDFTRDSSKLAPSIASGNQSEIELDARIAEYDKKADALFSLLLTNGSAKSIEVYSEFVSDVRNSPTTETFFILPLLVSQVKYEATGEVINPKLIQENLMPEFAMWKDQMKACTNDLIVQYNLSNKLLWK